MMIYAHIAKSGRDPMAMDMDQIFDHLRALEKIAGPTDHRAAAEAMKREQEDDELL